ncbi:MAG: hypothetical protein WCE42_23945 [Rhizobium ruizarguesonis]|jgi:hypothetical protein
MPSFDTRISAPAAYRFGQRDRIVIDGTTYRWTSDADDGVLLATGEMEPIVYMTWRDISHLMIRGRMVVHSNAVPFEEQAHDQ